MRAVLLATLLASAPAQAQGILEDWAKVQPPPPPKLSSVTLDPATTALLVLDLARQTCDPAARPRCVARLPNAARLIAHARERHWTVLYTLGIGSQPADILPQVERHSDEPLLAGPPDKFVHTDLEAVLHQRNIRTVVTIGAASEGAILQTAAGAAFRGFDVVVPLDAVASGSLYAEQYVAWDLVNAPRLADHIKLSAVADID